MKAAEVRGLLDELDRRMGLEVAGFWRSVAQVTTPAEFRRLMRQAFPDIVLPYAAAAAQIGTSYYDAQPSTTSYRAVPAPPPPPEKLATSAQWALSVGHGERAITLLQGAATRALFDGLRDTVLENVAQEPGARWVRHASANACGFCRMLATRHVGPRATFYSSADAASRVVGRAPGLTVSDRRAIAAGASREEILKMRQFYTSAHGARRAGRRVGDRKVQSVRGTQQLGDKFHDHCKCTAIPVRAGQDREPPPYVQQWDRDYEAAVKQARDEGLMGEYGAIDPKVIARLMDPNRR